MTLSPELQVARHRLVLSVLGATAALALWALAEKWDDPSLSPMLYLMTFTFIASYFSLALVLAGPVPVGKALVGSLLVAVPATGLVALAGLRHVTPFNLLDDPVTLVMVMVLVGFSAPFLQVWLQAPGKWRDYAALFDAAWSMFVRYLVAGVFVSVFWLVTFLSSTLLQLVGVDIIEKLLRSDWAPFALSGAVLGLGLAVVYELREKISPFLILRLLRLLVPVLFVVLVVFLVALPFRGLSDLFGEFSAAATLMGSAIAAITLISTALDRDDTRAVYTRGIRLATRALALLLPVLAVLAVWAVVERVREYGWTPDRVLAATAALFVLAYALGYAGSVARGKGWAARVRNVNVGMALVIIAVSVLWMTPVLNPFAIATNNQIARYESGAGDLDQLPLWRMEHDWGKAGQAGLVRLEQAQGRDDQAELLIRIASARREGSNYKYLLTLEDRETPQNLKTLAQIMPIRPKGNTLPEGMFDELPYYQQTSWLDGCARSLPDDRPGCVLVLGRFSLGNDTAQQAMVLYLDDDGKTRANHLVLRADGNLRVNEVFDPATGRWAVFPGQVLTQALEGAFDIRPSGTNALFIGDAVLVPEN
jgi:hypothetical protein